MEQEQSDLEEKRKSILKRLLDAMFGRRPATDDEVHGYVRLLGDLNKRLGKA
jgi:hypothetical protein